MTLPSGLLKNDTSDETFFYFNDLGFVLFNDLGVAGKGTKPVLCSLIH